MCFPINFNRKEFYVRRCFHVLAIPCSCIKNMIDVLYRAPIDTISQCIDFEYFLFVRIFKLFSLIGHY